MNLTNLIKEELAATLQRLEQVEIGLKSRQQELNDRIAILDRFALISETDTRGVITYANPRFCEVSGYTLEELIGKPHNIVRHPDMPKALFKELWETLKAGQIWQGEIKNRRKDGSHYWVLATVGPIRDSDGEICRYVSIRVDITAQKALQKANTELEESLLQNLQAAQFFQIGLMPILRPHHQEPLPLPHFVIWKPNQIVSGDFLWHHTERKRTILVAGDAMGHGVFGGMLSVLFMQQMRSLVELSGVWTPERLAAEIDKNLSQLFRIASDHPITVDGFIGVLDMARRRLSYTSLKGKAYLVREGQLQKLHSYPFSFGEGLGASAEEHEVELQPGDRLYILTDGL
ncbi:MAG: PAS domain-containing protein, partial [Bacteroidia bacterium]|nr:PAS domain-containing protein [Bacteroidia bacterium]